MNRKLWSNEEKVAIVLEILRGDEPAAVICLEEVHHDGPGQHIALPP